MTLPLRHLEGRHVAEAEVVVRELMFRREVLKVFAEFVSSARTVRVALPESVELALNLM